MTSSKIQPNCVYIHYSNKEHTYEEHVKPMLEDLHKIGIEVREDVGDYLSHDELSTYYPPFLIKTLNILLNN